MRHASRQMQSTRVLFNSTMYQHVLFYLHDVPFHQHTHQSISSEDLIGRTHWQTLNPGPYRYSTLVTKTVLDRDSAGIKYLSLQQDVQVIIILISLQSFIPHGGQLFRLKGVVLVHPIS
ncbi:hypothetical protein BDR06DRAFT_578526 [Suillus hirtellus]|nr:hypothetical protein BDR06DRAFT_578526 [Suillus hirtellus]